MNVQSEGTEIAFPKTLKVCLCCQLQMFEHLDVARSGSPQEQFVCIADVQFSSNCDSDYIHSCATQSNGLERVLKTSIYVRRYVKLTRRLM